MFDKKRLNFWMLAFVFIGLTFSILLILWGAPQANNTSMMDNTMGNMMKNEHVSNIKLYDLFGYTEYQQQMDEMHEHHVNQTSVIYKLSFLTTSVIYILLPLIIGGSILLAIVWLK